MKRALSLATNLFPLWVLLGGAMALAEPKWFDWFSGDCITWGLAVIMLGMGITLSVDDFKAVLRTPFAVAAGFVAQYLIMPFLGWGIAHLFRLETPLAVGLILYLLARLLRFSETNCRTISIEVGMQNSGLGAALARKHFPHLPDAALPCAISATVHSVLGSILAGLWRWRPPRR